ncbi:rod shape-determining protein RodA [Methylotenera mobilis]|uniref:Peptidoglycan glycosyltransferase MrdB n=1 Tax=Methylotenera mobilis (strain JLW8 / ATCC BAA-1282 / DSM 17540) TaxID=583345 RepID=C6WT97_METML|nr:rod shape-determining protein RodA [Methylotenera mobilis]ACT49159.1 rod shape-determining protein RodA [Methylotenera mobilis JLW8]
MISKLFQFLFKHLDSFLMACLFFALLLSLFVLYSASGQDFSRIYAQGINVLAALGVMWLAANISPLNLERAARPLYILGLLLLIAVALFGTISHGARRWLNLGFMQIQPSELMRIAVPMMLAWYFASREGKSSASNFVIGSLLLAFPVALIMKQPDLGTSLLIASSGFYVLFLAGLSWRFLLVASASLLALMPVFWSLLHDYQRKRIEILFDPTQDPLGAGYHTIQAIIAIGSGGSAGKGWLNGTQTQLDFLPERTTDFIFAVFSEEFGFLGNMLLLALFSLIIARGLVIASQAQNTFSRLLAGSITLNFFSYAFVNMGMVSGILPVVGVPLPLISYGGTSLVTLYLGFGILMSIHSHKKLVAT